MMETEGVAEYITRVETVVNQLSRNRETLSASQNVKILRFLTDGFENVVCAIEEFKDISVEPTVTLKTTVSLLALVNI